jgi:hypothetical protein
LKRPKILAFVVVALAALTCASAASAATNLYPDLKTLTPRALHLDHVDVSGGDAGTTGTHYVLRFSNTVWNAGQGPLVVTAHIDPSTLRGDAIQRVYDDTGAYTTRATGAQMYYHASHNHYHFDHWGKFQLWKAADYDAWVAGGSTGPEATGSKTTSCVLDEEFVKQLSAANWPGVYNFSGCNPDSQNNLMEGLSVGWGDTYDYWRADQWVDLGNTPLADGSYVLRSVVDPDNVIQESTGGTDTSRESADANAAILRFKVSGGQLVDTDAPTGTVMINNVAQSTTSPNVTVKALGRDDVSNIDQFRVSNDGNTWATYTYQGQDSTPSSISWDLSDSRYGGNSTTGTKTVYVQFHDTSGKWGPSQTDTIDLQTPPPLSDYAKAVLADTPVSYWRLGEKTGTSATDVQGHNPGTYVNSPLLGATSLVDSDQLNTATGFNGQSSFMRAGYSTSLDLTTNMSLAAWIKPSSLPAAGQFASVITHPEGYSLQFNGPQLEFTVIQAGVRKRLKAPVGAIQPGSTYHVVGTFDGATQRLYINGALAVSQALTGGASKASSGIFVGSWDGTAEYFNGVIDDPALYGKTLSATQVKAHYDTAKGAAQPQPPAAPSNLAGTAASDTQVDLTWKDNSTDESSFLLERATDSSFTNSTTINVANDLTSYSDKGLTASTTYWYRIRSRNAVGASSYSNAVSVTTKPAPATTAPAAPTSLVAGAVSDTRIDMSWTDNATNEANYVVERSPDSTFATVTSTTLPAGATSWSDTGRTANTTYWYRVKAVNAIGSSGYSNVASATTKPTPTGYAATVTADAPVSYWRLGETSGTSAADQRASNPGTYLNSPTLGSGSLLATDAANTSVRFDGVNDYVNVADANSLDLTSKITLEAWIKPNLLPAAGSFASLMTKAESYSLQFNGPQLEFTIIQNGARKRLQAPAGTIAAGQTYHVVGTYDGVTQRLYVNGSQVASIALTGAATVTPSTLDLASWNGSSEHFNGTIDEAALYNQALTATRVSAHYTAGKGTTTTAAATTTTAAKQSSTTAAASHKPAKPKKAKRCKKKRHGHHAKKHACKHHRARRHAR